MKKKHFFIDVLVYGVPLIISRGLGFILLPIYTRYLSPADYGVIEIITALFVILNLTLPLEIKQAMGRFLPERNNNDEKSSIVSTAYWFTCIVFVFFSIFAFCFPDILSIMLFGGSSKHTALLQLASISMLVNALFQVVQCQLRFELKAVQCSSLGVVYSLVTGGVVVTLLTVYDFGVFAMIWGQLTGSLISLLLGLYYCSKGVKIKFIFSFKDFAQMVSFSLPIVFSSMGVYFGMFIDRWMLAKWISLEEVGLYSVAFKFAGIISLLQLAIGQALIPLVYKNFQDPDTPEKIEKILRLSLVVIFPFLIFLSLFAERLLKFIIGSQFYNAAPVVVWLSVSVVLMELYRFAPGLGIMKKTKRIAFISLSAAGLNVVLNAILIPKYSMYGAASASIFSGLLMCVLYLYYSQKAYFIPYNIKRCLVSMAMVLVLILIFSIISLSIPIAIVLFIVSSSMVVKVLLKGDEHKLLTF